MDIKKKIKYEFADELGRLDDVVFDDDIITLSPAWLKLTERYTSNEVTADSKIDQSNDSLCVLYSNICSKLNGMSIFVAQELSCDAFIQKLAAFPDGEEVFSEILDEIGKENAANLVADLESLDYDMNLSTGTFSLASTTILREWGCDDLFKSISNLMLDVNAMLELEVVSDNTLENFCLDDEGKNLLSGLKDATRGL